MPSDGNLACHGLSVSTIMALGDLGKTRKVFGFLLGNLCKYVSESAYTVQNMVNARVLNSDWVAQD